MQTLIPKMPSLPQVLLENIFALVPYRHLLIICSRVCKIWSHVILDSSYMPFRTLYHRLIWDSYTLFPSPLLHSNEDGNLSLYNASYIVEQLCYIKYNITDGRYCMRGLLKMIETKMNNWSKMGQEKKDSELFELLNDHPMFTSTLKTMTSVNHPLKGMINKNNVWSLVTAMTMFSRDTDEILQLLNICLRMYPTSTVLDIFYGYTVIFLFSFQNLQQSNINHYKVHSALYLTENIILQSSEQTYYCEQALLINHVPSKGEITRVDYVPGVDIVSIVLKIVKRHSSLQFLIIESQPQSPLVQQLPQNAICSFSMFNSFSFSFDVLVLMPDSSDINREEDWRQKLKEISVIKFRNILSEQNKPCYNLNINVYLLMVSKRNQDLCWIMYCILGLRNFIIPVSTEMCQVQERSCEDNVLVICSSISSIYMYCYDHYCNSYMEKFCVITIDGSFQRFLDDVLSIYNLYDRHEYDGECNCWLPPPLTYSEIYSAYALSYHRTPDFIFWLKTKCTFNGEYHPSYNYYIIYTDMLITFQTMPTFSLVRLFKGKDVICEHHMIATITNNLKFDVLEIELNNSFEKDINTILGQQLATFNEINISERHYCLHCSKSLKDEYFALKQKINWCDMVAVRFTRFNSFDLICAQCANINDEE